MRIVHRVRAGRVTERLQSLDGSGREFVRANDELTCYLPDQHTVLVEPRQDRGPFLGSLPQFGASVSDFYRIEALPATRIMGRPARVIAVNPKDQFRFGYRLWLDETTAMPLKTQLCDSRGQVIEQIFFARLEMPESIPDSDLAPTVHTEGMRWVRQGPPRSTMPRRRLAAYRASELPPGFRLTVRARRPSAVPRYRPATWCIRTDWRPCRCSSKSARDPAPGAPAPDDPAQAEAAHAGTGPGGLGIRIFHRRAGSPSHRGWRSARADGGVHRPLGENLQRRRDSSSLTRCGFLLYSRPGCGLCEEMLSRTRRAACSARHCRSM